MSLNPSPVELENQSGGRPVAVECGVGTLVAGDGLRWPALMDTFERVHSSLRISVTDACNIRCQYCMPAVVHGFMPQDKLLSFEAIERVASVLVDAGITKVRLTGGEPLMRRGLNELVARLRRLPLHQIALTTNGMMLADQIGGLVDAGLTHCNISLDTLREPAFKQISRRDGLHQVLAGIEAALASPLKVRLNALVLRDINLEDCLSLIRFARDRGVVIRFIEFMPLDADRNWSQSQVVRGSELRIIVEREFGSLLPMDGSDPMQPSRDFRFQDGIGGVGFIDPVSAPFCSSCNRLRLTADGNFRNCLFGKEGWNVKELLDRNATDQAIYELAAECVKNKYAAHGISTEGFRQSERAMYQIGG